jgi:protein phosphatase methylesterase 1
MPPPLSRSRSHCDPVGWRECFDERHDVRVRGTNDVFRVYVSRPTTRDRDEGEADSTKIPNDDDDDATVPVLFCLHGCPYTALSFARFAQEMKRRTSKRARCVVVAMDLRGHGATKTEDERDADADADAVAADGSPGAGVDFSAERLVADVVAVTTQLYGGTGKKVVLLGHSMGGAIATRAAAAMMKTNEARPIRRSPYDPVRVVHVDP